MWQETSDGLYVLLLLSLGRKTTRCTAGMQITSTSMQAPALATAVNLQNSFGLGDVVAKVSDFGLSKRMKSKQEYVPNIRQGAPLGFVVFVVVCFHTFFQSAS